MITAGSIVSGEIPSRVLAGGVPAGVLRKVDGHTSGADVGQHRARRFGGGC